MNIKSSQDLVNEANQVIETLDPSKVKLMADNNECTLIDVRDIRELWKEKGPFQLQTLDKLGVQIEQLKLIDESSYIGQEQGYIDGQIQKIFLGRIIVADQVTEG